MQHSGGDVARHRNWSGPASLVVGLMAVAGGNIVFHLGAGRLLGPEEYGSLSALLATLLALAVPAGAIQVALTAEVARIERSGRGIGFAPVLRRFMAAGVGVAVAFALVSPWLGSYLRIDGRFSLGLVGAFFIPALGGLVLRSVLLGRERYATLGFALVGGTVLRLTLGYAVLGSTPTADAALFVTLISETATTLLLFVLCSLPNCSLPNCSLPNCSLPNCSLPGRSPSRSSHQTGEIAATTGPSVVWDIKLRWRELLGGTLAFLGFWLLIGLDTVLARHRLGAAEAGAYAAATLAAKTVLYAPQSIVTAALPRYAAGGVAGRRALIDSLIPTMLVGLAGMVVVVGVGPAVLSAVLGQTFVLSQATLAHLTAACLWASLLTAMVNYHLAQGAVLRANASWIGVAVVLLGSHYIDRPVTLSLTVMVGVLLAGLLASSPLIRVDRQPTGIGPAGPGDLDLTIVVPAFNEGPRLVPLIEELHTALAQQTDRFEIIVVDDGSTDDTAQRLRDVRHRAVRPVFHSHNQGKGAALRTGMARARGNLIGFIDGDGDLAPSHVLAAVSAVGQFGAHGAVGSKLHPLSNVNRTPARALLSRLSQAATRGLFAISVGDTQVGLKVFTRDVVSDVLPRTEEAGFLFDLEFLALCAQRGWGHVIEVPVVVEDRGASSVTAGSVLRSAFGVAILSSRVVVSRRQVGTVPLSLQPEVAR